MYPYAPSFYGSRGRTFLAQTPAAAPVAPAAPPAALVPTPAAPTGPGTVIDLVGIALGGLGVAVGVSYASSKRKALDQMLGYSTAALTGVIGLNAVLDLVGVKRFIPLSLSQ